MQGLNMATNFIDFQMGRASRASKRRGVMMWIPKGFSRASKSSSRDTMIFAPAAKAQAR